MPAFWWIIVALLVLGAAVILDSSMLSFLARRKVTRVKVGDISIYYELYGRGEPLVLIPGLGGSIADFMPVIPTLAQEYQVVAMDNRGAGRSDKPDIPYTMEMMAGDVAGLLNGLGLEKAHIFGVSLGGMIAQHLALNYPERVISLVLGCTTPGGPNSVGFEQSSNAVDPERREALSSEENAREAISLAYTRKFIDENPDIINGLIEQKTKNPPDPVGRARQFQAGRLHNTYERLPDIKTPTLVIAGGEDTLIPPENSRILASRIADSRLVILEGAGHDFITAALTDTTSAVLDFLRQNRQYI